MYGLPRQARQASRYGQCRIQRRGSEVGLLGGREPHLADMPWYLVVDPSEILGKRFQQDQLLLASLHVLPRCWHSMLAKVTKQKFKFSQYLFESLRKEQGQRPTPGKAHPRENTGRHLLTRYRSRYLPRYLGSYALPFRELTCWYAVLGTCVGKYLPMYLHR